MTCKNIRNTIRVKYHGRRTKRGVMPVRSHIRSTKTEREEMMFNTPSEAVRFDPDWDKSEEEMREELEREDR